MNKSFLLLTALASLIIASVPALASHSAPKAPHTRKAEPAQKNPDTIIVRVYGRLKTPTAEGSISQGTGFFINETTLITDYHVIADCDAIMIAWFDGKKSLATVRSANSDCDLVSLNVTTPRADQGHVRLIADSDTVGQNTPVIAAGYPRGEWAITNGNLTMRYVDKTGTMGVEWGSNNLLIDQGSSGSPIFNAEYQVIGILKSKSQDGQPYECQIVTANVIWEALEITDTKDHPKGFKTGVTADLHFNDR